MAKPIVRPFVSVGQFLLRFIGVPVYRFVFRLRRHFSNVYNPAKNRLLYLISNRYAVHFVVISIAAVTSVLNVHGGEVRAENFGEKSMLYALVSDDMSSIVEEVSAEEIVEVSPSNYMVAYTVSADDHFDLNYIDSEYVTPNVGASLVAPTISESREGVAPRTGVETYIVEEGDTLSTIAEKFALNLSSVLWANNLSVRSTIKPGNEVMIPPTDGVLHTVEEGDTLIKIANTYSADTDQILAYNKMSDADDLKIGEELMVPNGEPPAPVIAQAPAPSVSSSSSGSASSASSGTGSSQDSSYDNSGVKDKGSAGGSGTWVWPSDWRVITQYYGWRHTGLDIDGDFSTNNYAATDGVIVYTGWKGGYGLTVEIDHGGGVMTRYGHFSKIIVNAGDYVVAGQSLGKTGTTGRSTGTHLHFEVIVDGKFQNPLSYIR